MCRIAESNHGHEDFQSDPGELCPPEISLENYYLQAISICLESIALGASWQKSAPIFLPWAQNGHSLETVFRGAKTGHGIFSRMTFENAAPVKRSGSSNTAMGTVRTPHFF